MATKDKKGVKLTDEEATLVRDAFSHYGAEVKKLIKKSETLGLGDKAEAYKDTLRELGFLYGKVTGETLAEAEGGDEDDE